MDESVNNPAVDQAEISKRKGELVLSGIFMLCSLWFMYESVIMSIVIHRRTGAEIYTLPGVFPFIVSLLIFCCSILVIRHVLKQGEISFGPLSVQSIKTMLGRYEIRVFLITMLWMLVYVMFLMPLIPFEIATFIFVMVMFTVFKATRLRNAFLISLIFSVVVVYFFAVVVRTPFPHTFF